MNDFFIVLVNKKRRVFYCKNWDCMYLVKMVGYYRYKRKGDGIKFMILRVYVFYSVCIYKCNYL